ncbi:cupin domain-containing protein [Zunongwangia sp. F363]|uniref:Cupin domain-containing protein n=1 Tax=Autumnicola tepida TaxID=3075595 RepID=A0ABU3C9B1_9FLAO|nr:cupin domain-containing protein [Zunongwangia sp. F363]MDT0642917.1 cupin domain-containing protein [Zunongwangia sp. F363]
MNKVNLQEKFNKFHDHWHPRIAGELNGQQVKLAKFKGDFIWHKHEEEDEMFFVVKGSFRMEFRDKTVEVKENEFLIVPKGVEHRPSAEEEVHVMLFEPANTLHTGDQNQSFRGMTRNLYNTNIKLFAKIFNRVNFFS